MIAAAAFGGLLQATPWRLHLLNDAPCHRLFWITQGQGRVLLGPRRRGFGSHNLIFVPAGQPVAFDPGPAASGYVLDLPPRTGLGRWPSAPILHRIVETRDHVDLTALCDSIVREQREDRPRDGQALEALASLVSVWLHRALPPHAPEEGTPGERLVAAFLSDLARLYASGDPMAAYAARLDVTAAHLSRVCKAQLGRSAAQLLNERIVFAARNTLDTTDTPIKDIASGLGFKAAAHFTRFIRAHTGTSPRDLRSPKPNPSAPRTPAPRAPGAPNVAFRPS